MAAAAEQPARHLTVTGGFLVSLLHFRVSFGVPLKGVYKGSLKRDFSGLGLIRSLKTSIRVWGIWHKRPMHLALCDMQNLWRRGPNVQDPPGWMESFLYVRLRSTPTTRDFVSVSTKAAGNVQNVIRLVGAEAAKTTPRAKGQEKPTLL